MLKADKTLQKFGILRRVFRGTGSIILSDGSHVRARFTLGQLTDTRLLICSDVPLSLKNIRSEHLEANSLEGTLTDGRKISATGLWIKKTQHFIVAKKTRLVTYSGNWIISGSGFDGQASVVFELVNFLYDDTQSEIQVVSDTHSIRTPLMTLALGDRQVQLRQIADYGQAVETLKSQRGVQITCTATTTISSPSEIDDVQSMVDILCDVMSVARGTLVCWTSFEIRTADKVSPYSQYRKPPTRPYAAIELIDSDDCENTKHFLEGGFRKCEELDKVLQVRKVARAFIETRAGAFIESRSLLIAVLVDYLANVWAESEGHAYCLNKNSFKKLLKSLKPKTEKALREIYPDIADEHLSSMLDNLTGLNRRSMKFKIEKLAAWLEIPFTPEDIESFIKARNRLAHEGQFPEDGTPETRHYLRMQHFLDRIILHLFGYDGPYSNFEQLEIRP